MLWLVVIFVFIFGFLGLGLFGRLLFDVLKIVPNLFYFENIFLVGSISVKVHKVKLSQIMNRKMGTIKFHKLKDKNVLLI